MNIFNTKNSIVTLLLLLNYSVIQAQKLVSKPFVGHTDSAEINI